MPLHKKGCSITSKSIHEWSIKDISSYLFNEKCVNKCSKSLVFSSDSGIDDQWTIKLEFSGQDSWITIECDSVDEEDSIRATHSIFMIDRQENLVFIGQNSGEYDSESCEHIVYFLDKDIFAEIQKSKILSKDTLVLCIELQVYFDDTPFPADYPIEIHSKDKLPIYCRTLYSSRAVNSDAFLIINSQGYPAHRHVLKQRCPEMYAKLRPMPESKKSCMHIYDLSPELLQKLLQFIYTDEVNGLDDYAVPLLKAAEKYKLETLKRMCEKCICDRYLTIKNSQEVMELATRCNAQNLIKYICLFQIANNVAE
ncbi:speckle-type POZ protein-like [Microplitis mediator]|uniref:speckle-type POZ protein-like n=1 Tax=Microplitis mediator TaxID=375433 RepID=UPI002557B5D1|nr:speckle-type POZ protein-like [Microplitis mediator]